MGGFGEASDRCFRAEAEARDVREAREAEEEGKMINKEPIFSDVRDNIKQGKKS